MLPLSHSQPSGAARKSQLLTACAHPNALLHWRTTSFFPRYALEQQRYDFEREKNKNHALYFLFCDYKLEKSDLQVLILFVKRNFSSVAKTGKLKFISNSYLNSHYNFQLFYAILHNILKFQPFVKVLFRLHYWKLQLEISFPVLPTDPQKYSFDFSQPKVYKYFLLIKKFHMIMAIKYCPDFTTATIAPNAWCRERNSMCNMTSVPRLTIDEFKEMYSLRLPEKSLNKLESKQLLEADGYRLLGSAPALSISPGIPPTSRYDKGLNRYIWVIDERGISYCIEAPVSAIYNHLPKHTNLTGGENAYIGGELWFKTSRALYISGGSGRYPPIDQKHLDHSVQVFRDLGYNATSLGWDIETDYANRYLKG